MHLLASIFHLKLKYEIDADSASGHLPLPKGKFALFTFPLEFCPFLCEVLTRL